MDIGINTGLIFSALPHDRQKEIVHTLLINPDKRNNIKTMIVAIGKDDESQRLDIDALIENEGIEAAEDLLINIMSSSACSTHMLDANAIDELMEKVRNGTATKEEKCIAEQIMGEMMTAMNGTHEFITILTQIILDLMHYVNETGLHVSHINDIIVGIYLLSIGIMCNNPKSVMYKHKDNTPSQNLAIGEQIAQDIQKCLEEHLWKDTDVPAEYKTLGALKYIEKVSAGNPGMFGNDVKAIANFLGLEHDFISAEEINSKAKEAREKQNKSYIDEDLPRFDKMF